MRRSSRSLPILDLLLALVVAVVAAVAVPAAQAAVRTPSAAPLNPAFVAFRHNVAATAAHGTFKALVPAPVNSRSWAKAPLALGPLALATSYDLRNTGKLSPVRDQGDYNTCWSFASLASLESYLLPVRRRGLQRRQPRHGRRWRLRLRLQRRRQLPDGDRRAHPLERSGRRVVRPL